MEWLVIDLYLGDDLGRVARRVRSSNVWFKAYRDASRTRIPRLRAESSTIELRSQMFGTPGW